MGFFSGIADAVGDVVGGIGDAVSSVSKVAAPVASVAGALTGQPWLTALGTGLAGGSVGSSAGSLLQYQQGVATNEQNAALAQKQMDFQAAQNQKAMDFTGSQSAEANRVTRQLQQYAIQANSAAADKAMAFSDQMSSTAYQRAVKDMQAAGLNPMLAYSQGGASSPSGVAIGSPGGSGASGSGVTSSGARAVMQNPVPGNVFNTAVSAAKQVSEIQNIQATNKNIEATTDNIDADTALKRSQSATASADAGLKGQQAELAHQTIQKVLSEINKNAASAGNLKAMTALLISQLPAALNAAGMQDTWWMKYVSPFMPDLLKSTSALKFVK